jgi:hypothetical protein
MKKDTHDIALNTYRSLRISMVVIFVMLGIAVIFEHITATCWETSISAYYFTTAHSIFVAALCAIGTLLIVYEGSSDTEDVFLNLAGVLAFVVAMVPTTRPESHCGIVVLPAYDVTPMITNNVWAVVIAFVAVQLGYWNLAKRKNSSSTSNFGLVGLVMFWVVMAVGLIGLIRFRDRFDSLAHYSAAVILFAAIIVTVAITAFLAKRQTTRHRLRYHVIYVVLAVGMIVTLVAVVVLHFVLSAWNHWVIVIEVVLILEFAGYWVVQTIELWHTLNRKELLSKRDQALLEQGRKEKTLQAPAPGEPEATGEHTRAERVLRAL